jgi:Phage-related protein
VAYNGLYFNGHYSMEYGLYVNTDDFNLVSPERSVTFSEVPGVNGSFLSDTNSFKNITQSFTCTILRPKRMDILSYKNALVAWLRAPGTYSPLHFSGLPGYFWEAVCYESSSYTRLTASSASCTLNFNCLPFLKSDLGARYRALPATLYNETEWVAEPTFRILATGNVTLTVNGTDYSLIGVDGEVYVDSEHQLVYKTKTDSRSHTAVFPNHNFPVLTPGKNTLSVTGATSVTIKPNWRCLA